MEEKKDEIQSAPGCCASGATVVAPSGPQLAPEAEMVDIEYFSKIKLRIAKVEAAEALPKSRKLLKLQIDLGPQLGKRQILAGIAQSYPPESLIGKKIVVVANLKPATLMGQQSQGMLLAAESPDHSTLALLQPGLDLPEGSAVS